MEPRLWICLVPPAPLSAAPWVTTGFCHWGSGTQVALAVPCCPLPTIGVLTGDMYPRNLCCIILSNNSWRFFFLQFLTQF